MAKQVISFRGSMADDIAKLMLLPGVNRRDTLLNFIKSNSADILSYVESDMLVIGRQCERGKFPPDW